MSDDAFFKTKTTDHTEVYIRKDHVSAVEEIPGKGGTDPAIKLYVNGYSFKVKGDKANFLKELRINDESSQDLPTLED